MSIIAQKRTSELPRVVAFSTAANIVGLAIFGLLLWTIWLLAARPLRVSVDGISDQVRTHRTTVAGLLLDLGLDIHANDRIVPALETPLTRNMPIHIERAWPFLVLADGGERQVTSWGETPHAVLADSGVTVDRYDRVLVDGQVVGLNEPLPSATVQLAPTTYRRGYAWASRQVQRRQLRIQRAIAITVDDGGWPFPVRTTAETVGEALRQAEIILYLGDQVWPSLGSEINSGLRVFIQRSTPVSLAVDGRVVKTRTRAKIVADALADLKIGIAGADRVEPSLTTQLFDNIEIKITRIQEEIAIKEEIIPFETVFEADANLALDTQQVVTAGAPGITRQRYRVHYEDGQEVARTLHDSWVAQEAAQRVIAYGQAIEPQSFSAPDGTQVTYWRKMRVYASSYSAATAGVSPNNPNYGRTFTGERMRNGVVAVDPRVIPLRSKVYVPGYGYGDALDIGSAILGKHIDLGYADDDLVYWTRWVDVYLLWPPPPSHQITWVLPNYPREPN